ncbi:MAG: PadR family transcriptional regulator [Anaerolineales bacterium]|nr:PadR family transcriptional regulator [Anaerolineales bacterium]
MTISNESRRTSGLSPEYALLGFLEQSRAHGYELHQKLLEHLGEIWHTSLSQTYNILTRLEEQGFIQGTTQEQEKRPAKRRFHLTAAGKRRLETWMTSISVCSVRAIRVEFMTRLYFLYTRNPADALEAIQAQTVSLQTHIARLKERLNNIDSGQIFNCMGMSLRIRQLEVLVESLNECKIQMSTKQ